MRVEKDVTFLINSCDSYEDTWEPFFLALKKYWINFDYQVILNSESKKFIFDNLDIKCYGSSSDQWGRRLLESLKRIDTEYAIIFFDDYLINKYVEIPKIEGCIDLLEFNKDASVCYLVDIMQHQGASSRFQNKTDSDAVKFRSMSFRLIPSSQNYRLNSAPAIWRVADLISFTSAGDTPWVWEFFGSARTYKTNKKFFCVGTGESDFVSYVNDKGMGGAIHRGEWLISAVKFIEENLEYPIKNKTCRPIKISAENQPHSLLWKIQFLTDGFRAVGFDAFIFVYRSIIKKYSKLFFK